MPIDKKYIQDDADRDILQLEVIGYIIWWNLPKKGNKEYGRRGWKRFRNQI